MSDIMSKKSLISLAIAAIAFTLGIMKFTRHGSFDPSQVGFYTSIGAGALWFLAMYLILRRVANKRKNTKSSSK
jgi:hypothetical protein